METYNLIIWARDLEKYWVHFELGLKGIQDKNSALHCNDAYFWWTNFYYFLKVMSVADFQTDLNDISCKKYRKISQSKIMQHCSYLGCPLVSFTGLLRCLSFQKYLKEKCSFELRSVHHGEQIQTLINSTFFKHFLSSFNI